MKPFIINFQREELTRDQEAILHQLDLSGELEAHVKKIVLLDLSKQAEAQKKHENDRIISELKNYIDQKLDGNERNSNIFNLPKEQSVDKHNESSFSPSLEKAKQDNDSGLSNLEKEGLVFEDSKDEAKSVFDQLNNI